jgi:hypothetical protein
MVERETAAAVDSDGELRWIPVAESR